MSQADNLATLGSNVNSSGILQVAGGGTGATTATTAFNALNPMTTTGDIIYEASPTTAARLPIGTTGQVLTVSGGIPSWATLASSQWTTTGSNIYYNTGNVGIGTASPGSILELSSSATSAAAGFTSTNTNSAGYSTLQLKNTGASGRSYTIAVGGSTSANAGLFYVYDDTAGANRLNITSTGLLQFNSGYGSAATAYGCRAWVNFNGSGTVSIRGSGNVSSITDGGVGIYTVNLTTAMPDTNYAVTLAGRLETGSTSNQGYANLGGVSGTYSTSAFAVNTLRTDNDQFIDASIVGAAVFR